MQSAKVYVVHIVCGKRHKIKKLMVACPSIHSSVCPVDQQHRRRLARLLLRSDAGIADIDR